jgi:hypothetical protein
MKRIFARSFTTNEFPLTDLVSQNPNRIEVETPPTMEKPQDDKKKGEKEDEDKGPSVDFLKIDRTLRPEGCHFAAEMHPVRGK